jgi:F-type H+-transporting ATPase subunit a
VSRNVLIGLIIVIVLIVLGIMFPLRETPTISVAAEPLPWNLGPIPITNALLTSWLTMLLLVVLSVASTRRMDMVPTGLQNFMELVVSAFYDLTDDVAGPKLARRVFPIVMTIFLFVLVSNWIDLLTPVLAAVGFREVHEGHDVLIPILRAPSTDLNMTIALALISVFLVQVFGVAELGLAYFGKFINLSGIRNFIAILLGQAEGSAGGTLAMGLIDFFMGIIELISEIARVISFSFRLFGNIFAGEVLLLVMPTFLTLLLPLPFMGLEVFVGVIQAFIFAVLTLAFITMATLGHAEGH